MKHYLFMTNILGGDSEHKMAWKPKRANNFFVKISKSLKVEEGSSSNIKR